MRQHTSKRDGCLDERVQFFVSSDCELQVSWGDTLDLEIFCCVTCQFENFGSEVFEDGSEVDCSLCADARLGARVVSEMALYSTAWELW